MNHRLRSALSPPASRAGVEGPVTAVAATPMPGPLVLDLIAALVQSGAPPQSALRSVGESLRSAGDARGAQLLMAASRLERPALSDTTAGGGGDEAGAEAGAAGGGRLLATVEEALLLAARSGLPPTALVRRAAEQERRRQISAQLKAIRRLEVLLVIPGGLCLLPAFVLLGIVPLVLQLILG